MLYPKNAFSIFHVFFFHLRSHPESFRPATLPFMPLNCHLQWEKTEETRFFKFFDQDAKIIHALLIYVKEIHAHLSTLKSLLQCIQENVGA